MSRLFQALILVTLAGIPCASGVCAQTTVWRIDPVHSTARLYVASSHRQGARINVGVARLSGEVLQNADSPLPRTFAFQIYPADRTARTAQPQEQTGVPANAGRSPTTSIRFKSKSVELLDANSVLVAGDLTATYISRDAEYDPSKGYSGPTFGPPITHTAKREVRFVLRVLSGAGSKKGNPEWSASSAVAGDVFPELWNAVVTTDWPAFVLGEQCTMPSGVGEDFSGPKCKGKIVEPEPRTDAQCTTPSQVGEDFTDSVCSGTPLPAIPKSEESHHLGKGQATGSSDQTMANEVEIELVVWLAKMNGAPALAKPPAGPGHPTADTQKPLEVAAERVLPLTPNQ